MLKKSVQEMLMGQFMQPRNVEAMVRADVHRFWTTWNRWLRGLRGNHDPNIPRLWL
jgi:hypothetical protein